MSENALPDRDFRGILVESCRPESASVGVKSGVKDRSQISGFQYAWMLPAITTGRPESPDVRDRSGRQGTTRENAIVLVR